MILDAMSSPLMDSNCITGIGIGIVGFGSWPHPRIFNIWGWPTRDEWEAGDR